MAKTTKNSKQENSKENNNPNIQVKTKQYKMLFGVLLILFAVGLLISFISFFVNGEHDQSAVNAFDNRNELTENWLGKFGAYISHLFIYRGFGVASFLFVKLFLITGAFFALQLPVKKLKNTWFWDLFAIIVLSITFGFFATTLPELG